jgi:hypothetical protein
MWCLPTYGRPQLFDKIFDAPGGMPPPSDLVVYLTEGDASLSENIHICVRRGLSYVEMPPETRLGDILRDLPLTCASVSYGLVTDDHWPITPRWWEALEAEAGDRFIAHSVDPKDTSPLPGAPCFGGDLVRAMGTLAPGGMLHNYIDNTWKVIGEHFGLIRPLPEVVVEHSHWIRDGKKDATYERGSHDFEVDGARFQAWLISEEREAMYERIGEALGIKSRIVSADLSKVRLAVCLPLGAGKLDVELDKSLSASLQHCVNHGLTFHRYDLNGTSNIGYCRELLMSAALRSDCTHVLMVDDDMAWDDPALMANLIAADHDFVAAVGVRKTPGRLSFCCQFFEGTQPIHPRSGFLQVKTVGFGLCVIKRQVFEAMIKAYPKLRYDAHGQEPAGHALFCETIIVDPDTGARLRATEDVAFCHRWTQIAGQIYVDHQATLRHIGRFDYSGRIADVMEADFTAKEAAE